MNLNVFGLFAAIIAAVKVNDYRAAACAAGKLISAVTCATANELRALATAPTDGAKPAAPVTQLELYNATEQFVHDLRTECGAGEDIVCRGVASDADLAPGNWSKLAELLVLVLQMFIKRPADWAPTPLPVPPVLVPTLEEITGKKEPGLPPLVKPSDAAKKPPSDPEDEGDEDDESGDGTKTHDTSGDVIPPKKPKPKKKP